MERVNEESGQLITLMDLGNADSMLYNSGAFTLNNAMTMFWEVCIANTCHKTSTVSNYRSHF